jgi:anti-sigma factor RsiW
MNSHPEQALLLRYIDGELSAAESRRLERHTEACWDCRAELEELKKTVAECVHYRKEFLAEAIPEPPRAWGDLYREMSRLDAEVPTRWVFPWRWAVGAATAALAVAGTLYIGGAPWAKKDVPVSPKIEEPLPLLRNNAESGAASTEVPPRPAVPSRSAATLPGPSASISDELQVLRALHRIGADLGDPIHVSLSNGRVLVAGVGVTPGRQRQIATALDSLPLVAVQFSDPSSSPAPPESVDTSANSSLPDSGGPFQARLEAQLGGRGGLDKFAGQVVGWNDALMAHAYALRSLAQQFPDDGSLSESDRAGLHALAGDHITAMAVPAGNYGNALVPVLTAIGAKATTPGISGAAQWQASAEQLFQAARRVEMLSSFLLGVAQGEKANADLPSELLSAVSELRAHLEQNQRLLGR